MVALMAHLWHTLKLNIYSEHNSERWTLDSSTVPTVLVGIA